MEEKAFFTAKEREQLFEGKGSFFLYLLGSVLAFFCIFGQLIVKE